MRRLLALFAAAFTFACCATTFQWDPSPTPGVSLYELQWSEEGSAVWQAATTSEHEHSVSLPDGTYRARIRALPDGLPCLLDAEPCSASVWNPPAPHLGFVVGEAPSTAPTNNYDPGSLTFQYTVEEPPVMADPSIIQTKAGGVHGAGGSSLAVAFDSDVTAGNKLFAVTNSWNSADTNTITDSDGNTWSRHGYVDINPDPDEEGPAIWTAVAGSSGPLTVTLNGTSGNWMRMVVGELANAGEFDVAPVTSSGNSTAPVANLAAITQSGVLVIGGASFVASNTSMTPSGSWTNIHTEDDFDNREVLSVVYQISTGAGAYDPTWTLGASRPWGAVAIAFAPGASSPTAESETTTLAAVLQKQNNARTASLSANLQKAFTGTASTSAVLAQIIEKQTATAATLQAEQADTTTLNAALKQALSLGASLNVLQQLVQSDSVSTSAALRYDATTTLTLDSAILANRSLISSLNSALQVALTNTATLNAVAIQETAKSLSLSTSVQQLQSVGLPLSAAVAQRNEAVAALASVLERAGAVATAVTALAQSLGSVTTALSFSPQNLASVGLSANAVLVAAGEVVNTLAVTALLQTSDDVQAAASSMIQALHEETLALTVPIQAHSSVGVGTNAIILGQVTDAVTATMVSVLQAVQAETLGLSAAIAQQDTVSAAVAGVLATQEQATTAVNTLAESSETSTATLLSLTLKQWVTTTVLTAAIQLAPTLGTTVNAVLAASSTQRTLTAVALLQHPGLSIASGVSAVLVLSNSVPVLIVTEPTITASVSGDAVTLISAERDIQTPLPLPTAITIVSESTDVEIV